MRAIPVIDLAHSLPVVRLSLHFWPFPPWEIATAISATAVSESTRGRPARSCVLARQCCPISTLFIGVVEGTTPHPSRLAHNVFDSWSMLARVVEFSLSLQVA
jgi:hypothetical protein